MWTTESEISVSRKSEFGCVNACDQKKKKKERKVVMTAVVVEKKSHELWTCAVDVKRRRIIT